MGQFTVAWDLFLSADDPLLKANTFSARPKFVLAMRDLFFAFRCKKNDSRMQRPQKNRHPTRLVYLWSMKMALAVSCLGSRLLCSSLFCARRCIHLSPSKLSTLYPVFSKTVNVSWWSWTLTDLLKHLSPPRRCLRVHTRYSIIHTTTAFVCVPYCPVSTPVPA